MNWVAVWPAQSEDKLRSPVAEFGARAVYVASLLQANDPLVHYVSRDMNAHQRSLAIWGNGDYLNGVWTHSDDVLNQPLPVAPAMPVGGRYQPWGNRGQMAATGTSVDANTYNVAYKDPWVWGSDYWNFPTGQAWNLGWVGQVHRGTPWQTIFLKSTNILSNVFGLNGLLTWCVWTGDYGSINSGDFCPDAASMAPVMGWQLVGLLAAMVVTNGQMQIQFTGYDGHSYALETSLDLLNWTSVSTNSPVNGVFEVEIPVTGNGVAEFYRTVLIR